MTLTRRQVLSFAGAGGTLAVAASPMSATSSVACRKVDVAATELPVATAVTSDDHLLGDDGSAAKRFDIDLIADYGRQVVRTLGNGDDPIYPLNVQLDYQKTDIATPTKIGLVGSHTTVNYGSQGAPVAASGSVLASETSLIVRNGSQAGSEQAASFAVLRYDQAGGGVGGTPGRGWLADWSVHGAITVQQQILTGLNIVLGNYYNGQPSESPSVGIALAAGNNIGGSLDVAHAAATRYPNGVGLMIVGSVAGGTGRGWETGIQLGGSGSGWNVKTSKLGCGIEARDYETAGIRLHTRSGTAAGIVIESTGGPLVVGKSAAVSSVMTIAGTFVAPAADPASAMISFLTNDAQARGRGASLGLGGNTTDAAGTARNFGVIAGRKANDTTGDTSGYLALYTNKSGVGLSERVRISEDGDLRLLTNFMEWDELAADPVAPASNKARLYARDNGSGKTQLVVRFPTGAVQVLATEPA